MAHSLNSDFQVIGETQKTGNEGQVSETEALSDSNSGHDAGIGASASTNADGTLIKPKPAREIYKPPNLRRSRSGHQGRTKAQDPNKNFNFNGNHSRKGNASGRNPFSGAPYHEPGTHENRNDTAGFKYCGHGAPPLNVNAKEFQIRNTYPRGTGFWKDGANQNPQPNQNFPLAQSKSSGTMFSQFQKYWAQQEREEKEAISPTQPENSPPGLLQSKSSGNLTSKPRVRFMDETQLGNTPTGTSESVASRNELLPSFLVPAQQMRPKSQSQRGQTIFYQNPTNGAHFRTDKTYLEPWKSSSVKSLVSDWRNPQPPHPIKRSKSFGSASSKNPTTNGGSSGSGLPDFSWAEFKMNKWPKGVVESVKMAMNGVERVPARHKIDMVTRIFGTIFGDYDGNPELAPRATDWDKPINARSDFILPAVHIFLYFIQREKDQTVKESLVNNCLATFQNLFQGSSGGLKADSRKLSGSTPMVFITLATTTKWIIFLQLLAAFYQKGKSTHLNRSFGNDFINRFLSLLCDSCLVVLRFSPVSYTSELVDTIFTVMTSLGRDMEMSFPLKMKQILAGVRDALLGLNASEPGLSPEIQKTLMQVIELHAANWQLPASAVRYYYSNAPFK